MDAYFSLRTCPDLSGFASLIRDTENAENNNFSITVEWTVMEKHSAAYAAKRQKALIFRIQGAIKDILLPKGLSRFAFRRLSEKQKNQKLCALSVSAVNEFL